MLGRIFSAFSGYLPDKVWLDGFRVILAFPGAWDGVIIFFVSSMMNVDSFINVEACIFIFAWEFFCITCSSCSVGVSASDVIFELFFPISFLEAGRLPGLSGCFV